MYKRQITDKSVNECIKYGDNKTNSSRNRTNTNDSKQLGFISLYLGIHIPAGSVQIVDITDVKRKYYGCFDIF